MLYNHLSSAWVSHEKPSSSYILLVMLQENFEIDRSWEWKGQQRSGRTMLLMLPIFAVALLKSIASYFIRHSCARRSASKTCFLRKRRHTFFKWYLQLHTAFYIDWDYINGHWSIIYQRALLFARAQPFDESTTQVEVLACWLIYLYGIPSPSPTPTWQRSEFHPTHPCSLPSCRIWQPFKHIGLLAEKRRF